MRVSGKNSSVGSTRSVATHQRNSIPAGSVGVVESSDALNVSSRAQWVALAQAELARVPDVRTDKVEALREALDKESYSPDGEAVADGLIREHSPVPRG